MFSVISCPTIGRAKSRSRHTLYVVANPIGSYHDAGAASAVGIRVRGSDPTRINVTIDGIPPNDPESQGYGG